MNSDSLAHHYMRRERPEHTLQTSALVNEAFLRLADQKDARWQNRAHFFAISAQVMRHILIDHARSHTRAKRGANVRMVSLDGVAVMFAGNNRRARSRRSARASGSH